MPGAAGWEAEYSYQGDAWVATVYSGGSWNSVLLEANGTPVVAARRAGRGLAVFVSLNMFYHASTATAGPRRSSWGSWCTRSTGRPGFMCRACTSATG
ncbi:hypothetical protein [Pyrodictium occultum]|uniref:hypothetical protein n=1 Tax=Pyrodictium occultum TaxID=2309 RepID=UPI001443788C|nr:hypothetical protein [Pyrodictium occultum]